MIYEKQKYVEQRKFNNQTPISPIFYSSQTEYFDKYMILCLNKKQKNTHKTIKYKHNRTWAIATKKNKERECLSSIIHWFGIDKEFNLKISIDSKTNPVYEKRGYNKLLRMLTILVLYYFYKRGTFKLYYDFDEGRYINIKDTYIESEAINPLSASILLTLPGFKVVKYDKKNKKHIIDEALTEQYRGYNLDQLAAIINSPYGEGRIYTRCYFSQFTEQDIKDLEQQIKAYIVGKSLNSNGRLNERASKIKCFSDEDNEIQTQKLTNVRKSEKPNTLNEPKLLSNVNKTSKNSGYATRTNTSGSNENTISRDTGFETEPTLSETE